VTYNNTGSSVTFYVEGVPDAPITSSETFALTTNAAVDLRADTGPPQGRFQNSFLGLLDEVEVFNRVLSGTEIAAIYKADSAGKCKPSFQIRYVSNLNQGDSVVNITNTGDFATATNCSPANGCVGPEQNNINANICVNIYTFASDEQEVACCSCLVTPNALWSASVKTALLNSTLTPSFPNEVVIKLIATNPRQKTVDTVTTQSCNPASIDTTATPGTAAGFLANGLLAWGTTTHGVPTATGPTFSVAETPFATATLSAAELQRDVQECQFIQILGSGQFGICKGCSNVGLGAAAQ
jgi:hypothetical protein